MYVGEQIGVVLHLRWIHEEFAYIETLKEHLSLHYLQHRENWHPFGDVDITQNNLRRTLQQKKHIIGEYGID